MRRSSAVCADCRHVERAVGAIVIDAPPAAGGHRSLLRGGCRQDGRMVAKVARRSGRPMGSRNHNWQSHQQNAKTPGHLNLLFHSLHNVMRALTPRFCAASADGICAI